MLVESTSVNSYLHCKFKACLWNIIFNNGYMFYFQVINNGYLFCFQAINLSLSLNMWNM